MHDHIIRGMAGETQIRFFAVNCTEATRKIQEIHELSITTSVLMGRLMAAALMMGYDLKSPDELITLKINSDGAVSQIILTASNQGYVKGYINNPKVEVPLNEKGQINVAGAIGTGVLTIIKDIFGGMPYSGQVEIKNGEIASDLAYYFVQSEQTPTAIGLGVLIEPDGYIRQAGGFMIQLLPEAGGEVVDILERNLEKLPNLTDLLDMGFSIEKIVKEMILMDLHSEVKASQDAEYHCDCSAEKFEQGLSLLDKAELQENLDKDEDVVVICHFCNTKYHYGKEIIAKHLAEK
ncbi:MAG: Hsp33 family molecular chaperone HslO [Candidatus Cloacimonetes bacterium]|nr:Hsp33 family molecular chaperone HslO [Candidatus Cloacimonadota bacterium]